MKNEKIQSIQGLRGGGCLMVFFSHALGAFGLSSNRYITFLYDGSIAVIIFFLLSGFFQYMSCKEESIKGYFKYLVDKCTRIYPAYIIMLLVGTILCNIELNLVIDESMFSEWFSGFWKQKIMLKDLLCQIPIIGKYDSRLINSPIWTMYAEMEAVVLLPILDLWYRKKKSNWIIYCTLAVTVIFNTFHLFPQIAWKWMGVCLIGYIGKAIISSNEKLVKIFQQNIAAFAGIFLNILIFQIRSTMSENLRVYTLAVFCMMLILIVCYNDFFCRIFSFKWLVLLGSISYEFYLVHFVVLLSLRPLALYLASGIYISLALGISIVISIILSRYICVPMRQRIHDWLIKIG